MCSACPSCRCSKKLIIFPFDKSISGSTGSDKQITSFAVHVCHMELKPVIYRSQVSLMTSLNQGDGSIPTEPGSQISSPETLINRLAERQAQLKAAQLQRIQQKKSGTTSSRGHSERTSDFLQRFLQTKTEILTDLNEASEKSIEGLLNTHEITQLLDDTVLRLEEMQKSLNDATLYLTAFDSEQARLEFKSLNDQFQIKREQLLPTKKFAFTRKAKPSNPTELSHSPVATDEPSSPKSLRKETVPKALCTFDELFSFVNVRGPATLHLPKTSTQGDSDPLSGQSLYLADLIDCTVHVQGVCGNMIMRRLRRCRVYTFPVAGSVWIEDCHECDLIVACRQLRVHQTTDCRLGLHMASRPIIENSTGLNVGPYPLNYPELEKHLQEAGLSSTVNLWREVEDFSHPNKRLTTGSPNWSILPECEWKHLAPIDV
ncbi:Tubulin-specific chaperone C [Paragonimus heterotremus]|uniref:Tubulin-specific chaperone C n=1 Tax=Paragonimus heterotremus TaxID=100268 RepID=A0A8J4SNE1_9TREM|nr:Tubulin-specific chaperone C [Paragonimus heterotremus]